MIVEVDPRSPVPAYEQLRRQIATMIARGTLEPETRLPPIRQLAADLDLAPGTVARAYRELEGDGLVVARGRRGTRVTDPSAWSSAVDAEDARRRLTEAAEEYATLAHQLGVAPARALDQVREALGRPDRATVHDQPRDARR